jgi:hypothetical protein
MGILNRLFGKNEKKTTAGQNADEHRKQIAKDYPENWLQGFEFLNFQTEEMLKDHLFQTIENSNPQRVLIVGGTNLFRNLTNNQLPKFDIYINSIDDLGWLCEFCKQVRRNQTPAIVISNFPREYAPPKVRFVVGSNYVAKVGNLGGTVYETVAPPGASVALCEKNDQKSTMSIFFYGIHALSYYDAVLKSQSRRPDQLITCAVLTTPSDSNLLIKEGKALESSQNVLEHRKILIGGSVSLELFARFYGNDQYLETTAYSGGILADYKKPEIMPSRARTFQSEEATLANIEYARAIARRLGSETNEPATNPKPETERGCRAITPMRFRENLTAHLQRIRQENPQLSPFLDKYFKERELSVLVEITNAKMLETQSDGDEHGTCFYVVPVFYQISTLWLEISQAREWFKRRYGGYTKFLERSWDSEPFSASGCTVFCHIVYGMTDKGGWVQMAIHPVKQPVPVELGQARTIIMPTDLLSPEEVQMIYGPGN